ncbi:MAG: hypothetical protein R3181_03880, partial [Rubricoccaceae bacterium]|nr:hypothetical protein [Rubricoccaceae bacterium]
LPTDDSEVRDWALEWRDRAQGRLLDSYLAALTTEGLVPEDARDRELLLDKALYEVRYELGHRPDWLPLPLRSLRRLLRSPAATLSAMP